MSNAPAKTSLLIRGAVPIVFQRELAHAIGLNQAIVLQELAYLFDKTTSGKMIDGNRWIYNTYEEWQENFFPFFSVGTLVRVVQDLEKRGLLLSCQPEGGISRRKYYRLGEGAIAKLTMEMYDQQLRTTVEKPVEKLNLIDLAISKFEKKLKTKDANCADPLIAQNESFIKDANCAIPLKTEDTTEDTTDLLPAANPQSASSTHESEILLATLATLAGEDPSQVTNWGKHRTALKQIQTVCKTLTPQEITRRAANYRTRFPTASITSTALSNHWATCDKAKGAGLAVNKPAKKAIVPQPYEPIPQPIGQRGRSW
jgi:DNA-binding PadR family transcriptional regulator